MSEVASWALAGTVASVALLSLGATTLQRDHDLSAGPAPRAADVPASQQGLTPALLAHAYFDFARAAPPFGRGTDDWFLRHEITLKGIAAQRGENPMPEDPGLHQIVPADASALKSAQRLVAGWRDRLGAAANPLPALSQLTAAIQVRYDWWLLLTEAGAPAANLAKARALYEDARIALDAAAAQSRIAAL